MMCPTYGNCPTCYSSGPLAEICTKCLEKEIIGPDSTMKLHRYSSFLVGPDIRVDAEQLSAGCPTASQFLARNSRECWVRTPPAEYRGFSEPGGRFTAAFRSRWMTELASLGATVTATSCLPREEANLKMDTLENDTMSSDQSARSSVLPIGSTNTSNSTASFKKRKP